MEYIWTVLKFVYGATLHMLPFFIASIVIASAINTFGNAKTRVSSFTNRHPLKMIVIASLLGTLSPFCSCGVIPIVSGFLIAGAPISPVLAFWIASPLMDPDTFIITLGGLGIDMALFRLAAAFVMGLAAGLVGLFFVRNRHLKPHILLSESGCGCKSGTLLQKKSRLREFLENSLSIGIYLGKWLLLAFVLEAIIVNYVPMDWIKGVLGRDNPYSIVLASLIGLPLYVNGISAVPIVKGLMTAGMSHGAAMAFLISGPVTTLPAMIAVTAVAKRKLFTAYLLISFIGAVIMGFVCQLVLG